MNEGRMLRKMISRSRKFASLSKDAKILFCMLIPHYDPHGKMNGSPNFIKGEVAPYINELTVPTITKCLQEISNKTSVKWFQYEGLWWLHSTNDQEHQNFNKERIRKDLLPNYKPTQDQVKSNSGVGRDLVTHKEEEEVEQEVEKKHTTQPEVAADCLFETFWAAYPRKTKKYKALESWNKLKPKPNQHLLNQILSTLSWQVRSLDWTREEGRYVPHASTWLNNRRWLDEPVSNLMSSTPKKNYSGPDIPI